MFRLQFNSVFLGLMSLAFVSAFLLPPKWSDAARTPFESLFVPISLPTYRVANWVRGRTVRETDSDPRDGQSIENENNALRQELATLHAQIDRLTALAGERQSLGDLSSLCTRLTVAGTDSGNRDGLILAGPLPEGIRADQPVLYGGGLAGRTDRIGLGAAHVRLVTDAGMAVSGQFVRFVQSADRVDFQEVAKDLLPIVRGIGGGEMEITNLADRDVTEAGVRVDDWVVLRDPTWPDEVQNWRIGRVASITPWQRAPQFAEIRIAPQSALLHLQDLWVMVANHDGGS